MTTGIFKKAHGADLESGVDSFGSPGAVLEESDKLQL